jgi:8-oxo-dGTP diphosphatase
METTQATGLYHHVAVGILLDEENRILISKRPQHKLKGGYWEFPGGKIELGESPEAALIRELTEEIGIFAISLEKFKQYQYTYATENYQVLLEVFIVKEYSGVPTPLEDQELQWLSIMDHHNLLFLEPNKIIIRELTALSIFCG